MIFSYFEIFRMSVNRQSWLENKKNESKDYGISVEEYECRNTIIALHIFSEYKFMKGT